MNLSLAQIQQWLPGSRLVGDPDLKVARVHTDSRTVLADDVFVALRGERFDAHDYLLQLPAAGVKAAIAQQGLAQAGLMGLEVADTKQALGQLAQAWRAQFKLPLIAVTGSNGKTTVTQMVASILHAWQGEAALATQGNFNNDIGLPLTLLRLRDTHRAAVVELGMNHPGEIARWLHGLHPRSRWSTTRSASTKNSCKVWKRWRWKTVLFYKLCQWMGGRFFLPAMRINQFGATWLPSTV